MSTISAIVQIPADAQAPIFADFTEHALRIAYVQRAHRLSLPNELSNPGIYVLLTTDGSKRVYVGQARDVKARLNQHSNREKIPWSRAVIVQRDTTAGFNTAEIGYLEGRVAAELSMVDDIVVVQGQTSGDNTLVKHLMVPLDAFVKSILGALRLAGLDVNRSNPEMQLEDEDEAPNSRKGSQNVTIADLVAGGLLQAGTELYLTQADVQATAIITADGEIVMNGVAYRSPSGAATRALGQSSNGWLAWKVESRTGLQLGDFRQEFLEQRAERTQSQRR